MAARYSGRRRHQGIPETPEEPLFNSPNYGDFPNLLQDWLITLAKRNINEIRNARYEQNYFKQGPAAAFLFLVCDRLRLPYQVKFFAVELFNRFMHRHIEELREYIFACTLSPSNKRMYWSRIMMRVQSQLVLRVVTCCQIASKVNSHYKVVTVALARRFLLTLGHNYAPKSILQSEIRVLKTLGFRVTFESPLDYVEMLLQVLAHNTRSIDLPVRTYQSVSIKILTVLYLHSNHFYANMLRMSSQPVEASEFRQRMNEIKADKLLMGAAVVAASAYITDHQHVDLVIQHLHRMTKVKKEDIVNFVSSLVMEIHSVPTLPRRSHTPARRH